MHNQSVCHLSDNEVEGVVASMLPECCKCIYKQFSRTFCTMAFKWKCYTIYWSHHQLCTLIFSSCVQEDCRGKHVFGSQYESNAKCCTFFFKFYLCTGSTVSTEPVRVYECSRVVFLRALCTNVHSADDLETLHRVQFIFVSSLQFITSWDCVQVNAQKKDVRNLRETKTMDHGKNVLKLNTGEITKK